VPNCSSCGALGGRGTWLRRRRLWGSCCSVGEVLLSPVRPPVVEGYELGMTELGMTELGMTELGMTELGMTELVVVA
jgi:hypothetical protein